MKLNRLQRVIDGMREMSLDQILVTQTESIYYLTGLWVVPGERMLALKVDSDGVCKLYVNRMFALGGQEDGFELVEFDDIDDPVAILANDVKPGSLGIDKFWPSGFTVRLLEKRADVKPVVGSRPVDDARMMKDAEELEKMRLSSRMNDKVVESMPSALVEGMKESDACQIYTSRAKELGAIDAGFAPLICFGKTSAEPHHISDATTLKPGDAVIFDLGLNLDHMMSDMTRTVFYKSATDEQKRVYDIVKAANAAGKAAVRPGIKMSDIDKAARKVIEDAGYGKYFLHRTGHGIGLSVHEPPDCSSVCDTVTKPGMVFSIEPGIYLAGKFGVRIEDLVAVTPDGCEVLNSLDRELKIVG
ncbi:MAG: Xaa-Pro peptidase family protein [Clostridia bacterium]|nr:Xaa-Pro peptidase family protein [Clostridia bacterium]